MSQEQAKTQGRKRPTSPLQSLTEECLPDHVPSLAWIQRGGRSFRAVVCSVLVDVGDLLQSGERSHLERENVSKVAQTVALPVCQTPRGRRPMEPPNSLITNTQSDEIGPLDVSSEVDISHSPAQSRKKRVRRPTNDSSSMKKPPRNSSGPARSQSSSVPALDPTADPGEDLDPTVITMAAICEDTGQGRVSSKASQILDNHAAWKRSNKEKRTRMRALMEAKKYGRSEDIEDRSVPTPAVEPPPSVATTSAETLDRPSSGTPPPAAMPESRFGFDYDNTMATSRFNVQVRIGPNGETIVDEESLFVDRAEEHETDNYVHVEESDATKFVNSGSYSKKFRGTRWTAEETELFYAVSVPISHRIT